MLSYVFWHRRAPHITTEKYETALLTFHRSLAYSAPKGFLGSYVYRIKGAAWINGSRPVYEDWYLISGSDVLDTLNEAVLSTLKAVHDDVAHLAEEGKGGLYKPVSADTDYSARNAIWLAKRKGESYDEFYGTILPLINSVRASLWRRQLAMGPTPEFCILAGEVPEALAPRHPTVVERVRIWAQ